MKRQPTQVLNRTFDVLIVGGGITGAAVAYEAASRGLTVALFEKNDFGAATSAATSKMIHGGLRYLAKMEFALVRESLRERRILMNIAPNLVHPVPFLLTSYKKGKTPGWMLKTAMILYDVLSFDKNRLRDVSKKMPLHRNISKRKILKIEPEVISEGLQKGQVYFDGFSFSPDRLTLAFIKSAVKKGAEVLNYAEVQNFIFEKENRKITGLKVFDKIDNTTFSIAGKTVINCSGPWADLVVNKALGNKTEKRLRRSEGIHLITDKRVSEFVVTLTTKSDRHCFVVPWRNHTLIGTTDKEFIGNPDKYKVAKTAIRELLDEVNEVFGEKKKINFKDVKFAYGGLRPLVENQTKNVYESSRKYEIVDHKTDDVSGLITVEGGKYTTSRNLAEKVINKLSSAFRIQGSVSKKRYLEGCKIENFRDFVSKKQLEYPALGKCQVETLAKMYGTEMDAVLVLAEKENLKQKLNSDGEIEAQAVYAIRHEMAVKLSDIFMRRTGLGTIGHPGKQVIKRVAQIAAKELNWSVEKTNSEILEMEEIFKTPQ